MMELSREEEVGLLRQLRTLQGSLFEKLLKSMLERTDQELRYASGDTVPRHQGRAQLLDELLKDISDSRADLEKIERPKPDMRKAF